MEGVRIGGIITLFELLTLLFRNGMITPCATIELELLQFNGNTMSLLFFLLLSIDNGGTGTLAKPILSSCPVFGFVVD